MSRVVEMKRARRLREAREGGAAIADQTHALFSSIGEAAIAEPPERQQAAVVEMLVGIIEGIPPDSRRVSAQMMASLIAAQDLAGAQAFVDALAAKGVAIELTAAPLTNCFECRRELSWVPKSLHARPSRVAIRCLYCLRVYCPRCAHRHFGPSTMRRRRRHTSARIAPKAR